MSDLLTVAEVKSMDVFSSLTGYSDPQIGYAITDISAIITSIVNHEFPWMPSATITVLGDGTDTLSFIGRYPLVGNPTTIDGSAYSTSDHVLLPESGPPYDRIRLITGGWFAENDPIQVVGNWGWQTIPTDVKRAAFRLVVRYLTDESYRNQVIGSSSPSSEIQKVDIGEGKASVTFASSKESLSIITGESTGDSLADAIISRYVLRKTAWCV